MVVAAASVHWKNGFFITQNGYEFNLVLGWRRGRLRSTVPAHGHSIPCWDGRLAATGGGSRR